MKTNILVYALAISGFILLSFTISTSESGQKTSSMGDENWYLCTNCCKTKKGSSAPWENGCRKASSGYHNFQFCGKAGDFNWTCRSCDAEVYLTSSTSPSASKCCASGGTHSWYHR
jgi:hypothetical protein